MLFVILQMPQHNRMVLCIHSHRCLCASQPRQRPGMLPHTHSDSVKHWSIWLTFKGAFELGCFPGKWSIFAQLCETGMGLPAGLQLCLGQDNTVPFPSNLGSPTLSSSFLKALAPPSQHLFCFLFSFSLLIINKQMNSRRNDAWFSTDLC